MVPATLAAAPVRPVLDGSALHRLPPPPRAVRASRRFGAVRLWLGRLFILPHSAVGLGLLGLLAWQLSAAFISEPVDAVLTGAHVRPASGKRPEAYVLAYAYTHPDGRMEGALETDAATFHRLAPGGSEAFTPQPITLHHHAPLGLLPRARLEPGVDWALVGFLSVFTAFWNGMLSLFWWQLWVVPRRLSRLYREGELVRGAVLGTRVVRSSRATRHMVRYRFITPEGHSVEHETAMADPQRWESPRPGQPLTVLCDPRAPARRHVVYELGPYRVDGV